MTRAETTQPVTMPAIRHVDVPDYPAAHSRRCRAAPSPPAHRPVAAAGQVHTYQFSIEALGPNGAVLAATTTRRKFPE